MSVSHNGPTNRVDHGRPGKLCTDEYLMSPTALSGVGVMNTRFWLIFGESILSVMELPIIQRRSSWIGVLQAAYTRFPSRVAIDRLNTAKPLFGHAGVCTPVPQFVCAAQILAPAPLQSPPCFGNSICHAPKSTWYSTCRTYP
jgi:hypothetical protein